MTIEEAKRKLIEWAESQIGYREGSDNWNKYAENEDLQKLYGWKPQNEPWCDTWVDTGFIECFGLELASKLTYQPIGSGSAACRYSAGFYTANEAFYDMPQVGDQIFFFYDGAINHTGIVVNVERDIVYTVEGNTSDMVARRSYYKGSAVIAGYGRPNWPVVIGAEIPERDPGEEPVAEEPQEEEDEPDLPCSVRLPLLTRGGKGEYVKSAQILLNGRGASCGTYGADGDFGPATEAAVLAFQRRNSLYADGEIGNDTWKALLGGGKP